MHAFATDPSRCECWVELSTTELADVNGASTDVWRAKGTRSTSGTPSGVQRHHLASLQALEKEELLLTF